MGGTRATAAAGRVMIVIARLNIGGPASHVVLLAEGLQRLGYEVDLVCGRVGRDEGDMIDYAFEHGIEPIVIPALGRDLHPGRDVKAFHELLRLMRRRRPEIVHTHTAKAGFVGRWAARAAGVPAIVHTYHGHVFHSYFGPRKTALFLQLERASARVTEAIITLSPALKAELTDRYRLAPPQAVHVIPLGIDLRGFTRQDDAGLDDVGEGRASEGGAGEGGTGESSPGESGASESGAGRDTDCEGDAHSGEAAARGATALHETERSIRQRWAISRDARLVGIVGRLVPVKNHELFLRAARRVKSHLPQARFLVVGDGDLRTGLERMAEQLGLGDAVVFTGWVHRLAPLYRALDLTVITSRNEGTPVSLIEALAAECPVVATDVGGVRDLLRDGAWGRLVASGDEAGLAHAMVELLSQPPNMETVSREVRRCYSADPMIHDTAMLYESLRPPTR